MITGLVIQATALLCTMRAHIEFTSCACAVWDISVVTGKYTFSATASNIVCIGNIAFGIAFTAVVCIRTEVFACIGPRTIGRTAITFITASRIIVTRRRRIGNGRCTWNVFSPLVAFAGLKCQTIASGCVRSTDVCLTSCLGGIGNKAGIALECAAAAAA